MPTVLNLNGFRFFFYSRENNEPAHVHVTKGGAEGKIWLEPFLEVAYFIRFSASDQRDILEIVANHHQQFKNRWNEYFDK